MKIHFLLPAKMPTDYAYRKFTENTISERAALVKNESNVAELEKKINGGQIEEVIIQAENELNLSRKILEVSINGQIKKDIEFVTITHHNSNKQKVKVYVICD